MIIGWIRLFFFVMIGLSVVYVLTSIYSRSVRREKLEKHWERKELQGDREAFIEAGMRGYEKGLKRRLLWLIYIIPMIVFNAIFFYVNWF